MLKKFISLIPLLLPFAAYAIYIILARRRMAKHGGAAPSWETAPWVWLAIVGVALFIATLVGLALIDDGNIDEAYEPARIEDGRIVTPEER